MYRKLLWCDRQVWLMHREYRECLETLYLKSPGLGWTTNSTKWVMCSPNKGSYRRQDSRAAVLMVRQPLHTTDGRWVSCKTGMSVFCHGQRRARISIPLSTSGTCWWGLGPFPPRNVQELAGALVEEWGNISQQELANLVQSMRRRCTALLNAATPDTDCYFRPPPLFWDTLFNFC